MNSNYLVAGLMGLFVAISGARAEPSSAPAAAPSISYFAVSKGQRALDQGEGGGNPFASAFIELIGKTHNSLGAFSSSLVELTKQKSRGKHAPEFSGGSESSSSLPFLGDAQRVRRDALVLVVSDYSASGGAKSLAGAKHDADRVAAALRAAGFNTQVVLDVSLAGMREALAAFGTKSAQSDVALIYTTGHSVEVAGQVFLLPGDYPVSKRNSALATRALTLNEIAPVPKAQRLNLIFHGGCRDDPWAGKK